jgi:hypothetical protein
MTRPRRYAVAGDPVPEKFEVTKEDILAVLGQWDPKRLGHAVRSKKEIFVSCAQAATTERNWNVPEITWARRIIDVPAAERLLEKMLKDGLVFAHNGPEWYAIGLPSAGLAANGLYYAGPEGNAAITARGDEKREREQFEKATEMAVAALVAENQERYSELLTAILDDLKAKA